MACFAWIGGKGMVMRAQLRNSAKLVFHQVPCWAISDSLVGAPKTFSTWRHLDRSIEGRTGSSLPGSMGGCSPYYTLSPINRLVALVELELTHHAKSQRSALRNLPCLCLWEGGGGGGLKGVIKRACFGRHSPTATGSHQVHWGIIGRQIGQTEATFFASKQGGGGGGGSDGRGEDEEGRRYSVMQGVSCCIQTTSSRALSRACPSSVWWSISPARMDCGRGEIRGWGGGGGDNKGEQIVRQRFAAH